MPDMPVEIVDYAPRWQQQFAGQRDRLAAILRRWLAEPVEHVGSTAVPGLASKPIVDVLAPVRSLSEAHAAVPVLESDGWKHWPADPDRTWRLWFLRPRPEARTHHLYLIQYDDPHVWALRAFRDALRGDESLRDSYGALKRRLAHWFSDDRESYTRAKAHFVEQVLREAGIDPALRGRPDG